ncbi:MAG: penicillin-insensitive murein endopeptidase [Myxococcales bacterium]|nr:penicillin-insensitive murein endopeptidase [Myxococcales bacterium]MCB9752805.1 penicillin-insensitive murein endopeptidase [Myxococcales bacterium]
MSWLGHIAAVASVSVALTGLACAGPNLWTDLTSISTGKTNRGRTRRPAVMPLKGEGFVVPKRWRERGFQFGVDELVEAIPRAAQRVNTQAPAATLGIADLSARNGGRSRWHSSHQSGRDVDLIFYTTNEDGEPLAPLEDDMLHFNGEGEPYLPQDEEYNDEAWEERRFDTARNWLLIESLLSDPTIRLQWVFVSNELKRRLLDHARAIGRPAWMIEYAAVVMNQPGDAPPHDDHFHVRVYCSRGDRFHGCTERGVIWRHEKKSFKYAGPERYDPVLWHLMAASPTLLGPL